VLSGRYFPGEWVIKRICIVIASEITAKAFLIEQLRALSRGYEVTLVANTADRGFLVPYGLDISVLPVAIERRIRPWRDLKTLIALYRLFRQKNFDLVHSVTPKAGLLSMLAARLAFVPHRVHIFTGQVWATRHGFSRWLLRFMDCRLAASATHLLADSGSQRDFLVAERVVPAGKISVLASGSISGVDTARFRPDAKAKQAIRAELGIGAADILFLFVGRLNRDKGVLDLACAFSGLPEGCRLLFVGPDEAGMQAELISAAGKAAGRMHFVAWSDTPEHYMAAADVFCLPSYREGFGSVIIEAAACGIPAIASRIYGLTDAVEEGNTGMLFTARNVEALKRCMRLMTENDALRHWMGEHAMERARRDFASARVTQAWLEYYDTLL
jgi:glycosyltransferase involved in cell wall biosynthesis